jgi:4'-phosphopantetheinyl transferase
MKREMTIDLTSGDIYLWLAFYDQIDDEQLHIAYRALMNDQEKAQEARFHFADDRRRYLVTRALVRTVLSQCAPVLPKDWVFSTNKYGRPEVANAAVGDARVSFNISHTKSLIVLGVTRQRALGVDVENVRSRKVPMNIADRFFATEEVSALSEVPPDRQQDRFFEYWTFKESYIKARGKGLSIPLDKFAFRYSHERAVNIAIDPGLNDTAERWQFWQFRPKPEYLVAVCAERLEARSPNLVVREVVPASAEEIFPVTFLRTSE